MDLGRLTLKAAANLRLRLRIICVICGRSHVKDATTLAYGSKFEGRLSELRLTCLGCGHRDADIVIDQPNLLVSADPHDLSFHIEEWSADDQHVVDVFAAVRHATIARAAFDAAVETYPEKRILLRQRCFLMKTHPGKTAGGEKE